MLRMRFDIVAVAMCSLYKLLHRHARRASSATTCAGRGALEQTSVWACSRGSSSFRWSSASRRLLGVYRIVGRERDRDLMPALIASAIFPRFTEELFFRGILFRWLEEFGGSWLALLLTSAVLRRRASGQPQRDLDRRLRDRVRGGRDARRRLYADAEPVAADGAARGVEFHARREFRHAGFGHRRRTAWSQAHLSGPPLLTGGGFGLEASLIAIVIATAFGLWLLWLAIRKGELVQPMWVRRRRMAAAEA